MPREVPCATRNTKFRAFRVVHISVLVASLYARQASEHRQHHCLEEDEHAVGLGGQNRGEASSLMHNSRWQSPSTCFKTCAGAVFHQQQRDRRIRQETRGGSSFGVCRNLIAVCVTCVSHSLNDFWSCSSPSPSSSFKPTSSSLKTQQKW